MDGEMKRKFFLKFFIFLLPSLLLFSAHAKTVRYELNIENKPMNMSGQRTVDFALTVNGGIPAPTLEFTEGDEAEIEVKNSLPAGEVSIHWHGLLLPPEEDGVAYLNTPPIFPGRSRVFKFKLRQNGTYWYHSHTGVQEQKGVYGAIIIHPKTEVIKADKELVALISDWSDENPDQIVKNLKKDGDYYLYKKGTVRSYWGALRSGGLKNLLDGEWQRMGGMDLSDVGYDAFLINGKRDSQLAVVHPGQKIRLRIINAASSSYFHVSLAGLPMRVVAADGIDIEPVATNELLMGMAETYDVLFTVPEHKNFELRATSQDGTGWASAWLGMGERVSAPAKPFPDLYSSMDHSAHGGSHSTAHVGHAMPLPTQKETEPSAATTFSHDAHEDHSAHAGHVMPQSQSLPAAARAVEVLTVEDVKANSITVLPAKAKVTELKLILGGDMRRYVWHINGKAIHEDRDIPVNEGEALRITYVNETMMHHPMHLHGHFFRVLNQFGDLSPLKHTVDVPPHGTRTIEVYANEPGQWMLHCHNLYHMHAGMGRVLNYLSFKPSPEVTAHQAHDAHAHDDFFYAGQFQIATNRAELGLRASQTWNEYELRAESTNQSKRSFDLQDKWEFEGDALYRRWLGNYSNLTVGGTAYLGRGYAIAGLGVTLPMMIDAKFFLNNEGKLRLDLNRHFQWTRYFFSDAEFRWRPQWEGDHETEFKASLMYGPSWSWAAGLQFTENSIGIGASLKF